MNCAARAPAASAGAGDVVKRLRPSLMASVPAPSARREEDVGVAVLVQIAERRHRRRPIEREPDVGGDVAKRAVAEVPEEQGRRRGGDQKQVDIAPVVEVGGNDRDDAPGDGEAGFGRDVGESSVSVVAEEARRWRAIGARCHEQIEVAVVIDVEPGGRSRAARRRTRVRPRR